VNKQSCVKFYNIITKKKSVQAQTRLTFPPLQRKGAQSDFGLPASSSVSTRSW